MPDGAHRNWLESSFLNAANARHIIALDEEVKCPSVLCAQSMSELYESAGVDAASAVRRRRDTIPDVRVRGPAKQDSRTVRHAESLDGDQARVTWQAIDASDEGTLSGGPCSVDR